MALLELIIGELGPQSPDINAVASTGPGAWAVQFENGAIVHLAQRVAPSRLELRTEVASLPAEADMQAMRAILMFNFLSIDTGGQRMGLSAMHDLVFLIRDLPESELSLRAVQGALRGLADQAAKWALILDAYHEPPGTDFSAFGPATFGVRQRLSLELP